MPAMGNGLNPIVLELFQGIHQMVKNQGFVSDPAFAVSFCKLVLGQGNDLLSLHEMKIPAIEKIDTQLVLETLQVTHGCIDGTSAGIFPGFIDNQDHKLIKENTCPGFQLNVMAGPLPGKFFQMGNHRCQFLGSKRAV